MGRVPRHGAADVPRRFARAAGARTSDRAAVAAGRAGEPAAGDSADPAPAPQQPSLLPLPTDPPQEPAPPVVEPEPEPEPVEPLTFKLDEVGWQVAIPRTSRRAYHGRENVRPTNERTQARIYGELVRQMSCDASVGEAFFFGLVDEANLDRWQRRSCAPTERRRPAWGVVRAALEDVANGCTRRPSAWLHTGADRRSGRILARPGRRQGRRGRHRDDRRQELFGARLPAAAGRGEGPPRRRVDCGDESRASLVVPLSQPLDTNMRSRWRSNACSPGLPFSSSS